MRSEFALGGFKEPSTKQSLFFAKRVRVIDLFQAAKPVPSKSFDTRIVLGLSKEPR